ncbi:hypothetical protein HPP92_017648 [Vanilla planifolia]|uniref:DUF4378 domain-containing protein n=1 Tax=Vanilla planifolia TaxID=51239 RepID=A0A835Q8C5_VANPL|nr:hypothetical protein HPP92_017648 [Vanilla planifolia]
MGLDSLPVAAEMRAAQYNDSHSSQGSSIIENRSPNSHKNDQFNREICRDDGNLRKAVKMPDVASCPFDRFCMEMLPSNLVESPMVPHDKFSVSMKYPVVIPQNNLVFLRHEASKFLGHPSQANITLKAKTFRSSTTALKYKYSKETLTIPAPARPEKSPARSPNSAAETSLRVQSFTRGLNVSKVGNCDGKTHGKEASSTDKQATANVRVNDQPSSNRRKFVRTDPKSHQSLNSQNSRKLKTRAESAPDVTRKHNLKLKKGDSNSIFITNPKSHGTNSSSGYKTGNKFRNGVSVGNGPCCSVITSKQQVNDLEKGDRRLPHKKRILENNTITSEEKSTVDKSQIDSCAKCVLHNFVIDEHSKWRSSNMKNYTDVVSFTFATPIVKPVLGHGIPSVVMEHEGKEMKSSFGLDIEEKVVCFTTTKQLSTDFNSINGDALGILLEEKLKELATWINPPYSSSSKAGSEYTVVPLDSVSDSHIFSTSGEPENLNCRSCTNDEGGMFQFECSLDDAQAPGLTTKVQKDIDDTETSSCSSSGSHIEVHKEPDHPSPLSILETSFSPYESYDSPIGLCSTNESVNGIQDHDEECNQELKIVREILSADLMSNCMDFRHETHSGNALDPLLFEELQCKGSWIGCTSKRKLLFDCVGEFLELKISLFFKAGYRSWRQGTMIFGKGLAEQACKEISARRSLEGLVAEELMDWDMSSKQGRWIDFEIEAFELGEEIQRGLLSSLVEELVDSLLIDCSCRTNL